MALYTEKNYPERLEQLLVDSYNVSHTSLESSTYAYTSIQFF